MFYLIAAIGVVAIGIFLLVPIPRKPDDPIFRYRIGRKAFFDTIYAKPSVIVPTIGDQFDDLPTVSQKLAMSR